MNNPTTDEYSTLTKPRTPMLFALGCAFMLFVNLGAAALFEPDEGRNAERAREILLLGNWVIPHENFLPALDKPIFFYWLIAISYKLFGISEWSARLPSALAALGCAIVLYRFVRACRSEWESVASVLILVTSLQFFIFARIVIFDMTLTLFTSIALFSFYRMATLQSESERRWHGLSLYAAMALATLVKGPIGLALPGMVIFAYLLIARKWRVLREMHLAWGGLTFCAIVVPMYLWAEVEHPGYLHYFLWEENVLRFFTSHFQRGQPWYFFMLVVAAGFLPWSILLPSVVADFCQRKLDERELFLVVWITLPVLFFSLSSSKMPHYVLPIFPPLAILTAARLMELIRAPNRATAWTLTAPLVMSAGAVGYLIVGTLWQSALPRHIRDTGDALDMLVWLAGVALALIIAKFFFGRRHGKWRQPGFVFACYGAAAIIYLVLLLQLSVHVSQGRSARAAADHFAKFITSADRVVYYGSSLTGMPFYLRSQKPIWIVWSGTRDIVMDNIYVAEKRPLSAAGYGQVLFTYEEFAKAAQDTTEPLRIIVKKKYLSRLAKIDRVVTRTLAEFGEYTLATMK